MAGIGFELRKLAEQDNYLGVIRAYIHAAVVSAGPWLLTVAFLGCVYFFTETILPYEQNVSFRSILIYNFSFTLVISAPLYMITTRALSDSIYKKEVASVPGLMIISLSMINTTFLLLAGLFYFYFTPMSFSLALASTLNGILLGSLWITMLFLSAIKNFSVITYSFLIGIMLALFLSLSFAPTFGPLGMLQGFNIGLTFIVFVLIGAILAEYPYRFSLPKEFFHYFREYGDLAIAGFFYNAGVWVDKWIMWTAPEAEVTTVGLITYPTYDTAMFVSFLSIIPLMALFVFSIETNFFESYLSYFRKLGKNAPYKFLNEASDEMFRKIRENGRNFIILQGGITLVIIFLAPAIFDLFGMNYLQLGIFRLAALGAFFNVLSLFVMVFFSYFDSRENVMRVALLLFCTNALFTYISKNMGFIFYGYGYFLAMLVTFTVTVIMLACYLNNLSYHIFISNNAKRKPVVIPTKKTAAKNKNKFIDKT